MQVKMKNIGGLDDFEAEIQPNKVTYISAPNTAGKTSFVRGLEAVFGEVDPKEVINISKTNAEIVIVDDKEVSDLTFRKTPTSVDVEGKYPESKDSRASLISFILPDSQVVQDIALKDGDLKDFLSKISEANEYKNMRDKAKKELTNKKEMLEVLRKNAKEVPKLREIKSKLEGELNQLRKRLEETAVSEEARELQSTLNNLRKKMATIENDINKKQRETDYHNGRIDSVKLEIRKIEDNIKQLEMEIPELNFKPMLDKFNKRAEEVREKISHEVRPELNKAQTDVSKLSKELEKLNKGEEKAGYCPFDKQSCQRFSKDILSTQLDYDTERLESVKEWYDELNNEYKEYMAKITELKSKENTIVKNQHQVSGKERNIREIEDVIERIQNEIKNLEKEKNTMNGQIKQLNAKVDDMVQGKDEQREETEKQIREKTGQIKKIDNQIMDISKQFDPEKSVTELEDDWTNEIEDLQNKVEEFDETYENQLYGESKEFNKRVDGFLKILGFDKNFHSVLIDPNTQRLVVYKTPTESQPLNTLSTSERYALAILVMLIANKIYIPEFPLIVLDEVLISFDEERGKKVLDYIKGEVPYVITTALKESGEIEVKAAG